MSRAIVLDHPLVAHHLTRLRDRQTEPERFRLLVQRLTTLMAFEATKHLPTNSTTVQTPLTEYAGASIASRIAIVPILRAGLGMVDPLLTLMPTAEVWHLGMYRDEETAQPVSYYNKLPEGHPTEVAFVVDPMLATGGSASLTIRELRNWGVKTISLLSLIAAQPGIDRVLTDDPDVRIVCCGRDAELNAQSFIVPGLGDAGDRTFNTVPQADS